MKKSSPKPVQRDLFLARWVYPEFPWYVNCGSGIQYDPPNDARKYFSLNDPRDRTAVIMKLKRDHNITIKERARDGKPCFEAISHDSNMKGIHGHESLEILLEQVVRGLEK